MLLVSVLEPASFHWLEWLVWAWIISFICEEFNQYLRNPLFKWLQLFLVVKLISFAFFFAGYGLRIAVFYDPTEVTNTNYTHVLLGISYIGFSFGLLEICYSSEFFGPLMAMFKNMVEKLLKFMVIIFVIFFSYAVASESVLYPRSKLTPLLAYYVARRAFWGMFGEFFLNELESQEGDIDEPTCTNDPSLYEDYEQLRCPTGTGRYFVPVLLGIYFLTINILLFSILIAVFNSEIKRIEQKAEGVWRRHSLRITIKYHKMRYPAPIFLLFVPFLCKMSKSKDRFSPFLKEITKAEKPLQLRLSRIQEEVREKYIIETTKNESKLEVAIEPQIKTQVKEQDNVLQAATEPQNKTKVKKLDKAVQAAIEPQNKTDDNVLQPITITFQVDCPHADSPVHQKKLMYPVRGNGLNERAATAMMFNKRLLNQETTIRTNSNRTRINKKYSYFALRSRYKYGIRWRCVKVRRLKTKKVRHNHIGLYASVTIE
ncbi:transient receptor potential cation channel subfamily M member 1-like [Physella acuta]|uniref:transient receptor potential cation channel subfamily M member 1-like n=1 Tax=Physella acuta TaxID=109671 RepID=UPI0027DD9741|nr:transient receptor potential cation channel subfamily M member 1-like [Physella acuta]